VERRGDENKSGCTGAARGRAHRRAHVANHRRRGGVDSVAATAKRGKSSSRSRPWAGIDDVPGHGAGRGTETGAEVRCLRYPSDFPTTAILLFLEITGLRVLRPKIWRERQSFSPDIPRECVLSLTNLSLLYHPSDADYDRDRDRRSRGDDYDRERRRSRSRERRDHHRRERRSRSTERDDVSIRQKAEKVTRYLEVRMEKSSRNQEERVCACVVMW